jgi:hypothetical protein
VVVARGAGAATAVPGREGALRQRRMDLEKKKGK